MATNAAATGVRVSLSALDTIGTAAASVTTAGTRVTLANHECGSVVVGALGGNTGDIYLGGATVTAANGFILAPGHSIVLDINNTNDICIDADTSGDGIRYLWVA